MGIFKYIKDAPTAIWKKTMVGIPKKIYLRLRGNFLYKNRIFIKKVSKKNNKIATNIL